MSFDFRISKQAHAVIFSCKRTIIFQACSQKHLEMILDNKLNFEEHLKIFTERKQDSRCNSHASKHITTIGTSHNL